MPELPEVETTCRGIRPHLLGQVVTDCIVRQPKLRWPVPAELKELSGNPITAVDRRAKYILLHSPVGTALVHLGMSGSLRLVEPFSTWRKHDHLALCLGNGLQLRFHDPRRFGCWLWVPGNPLDHPLLCDLGPEPLSGQFNARQLRQACAGRHRSIKECIMDAHTVVGVGNIYACEALHLAGIHPRRAAGKVGAGRMLKLVDAVKLVLRESISQGGTTLRDFVHGDGTPGYFRQRLRVYDRATQPCHNCETPIRRIVLGQRSTFYCPRCQR